MKFLFVRLFSLVVLAGICAVVHPSKAMAGQNAPAGDTPQASQSITVTRINALPSAPGPADHFTGSVKMDTLAEPKSAPGHTRILSVSFAPGAYTAWHSHPLGQLLIVTAGSGFVQQWGGSIQAIHPGDVIWTPPNVKHWHGAGVKEPMTHLSIYEEANGQVTKWMEKVTPEEYARAR